MVLLVIDTQKAIVNDALCYFSEFITNVKLLIKTARENNIEVIYVRHDDGPGSELEKGTEGFEIYEEFQPKLGEKVFDKDVNSAFKASGLLEYLKMQQEKDVIITGLQTDYCIDASVKCAFEHGFHVIVPAYANTTVDNEFMTARESYRYYNEFMWNGRYAECVSVEEGVALMRKKVIHIYGASGSGTSTLGRKICEELGYTFMDTDDYFWLPTNLQYTTKRPKEERLALMKRDIQKADNVVISGSLTDWGDELIPLFTLAIRLETATELRIERLKKREHEEFGSRIEPGGDMYENHLEFIDWAAAYDTGGIDMRSKAKHDEWQKLLQCRQIVLNGADDLEENFEAVKDELSR